MQLLRHIGSLTFALGLFTAVFVGIPWYVIVADDPVVPLWQSNRRAIEDYDQTLRLDPGDYSAYNNRGNAYSNLGEYRRAIEDYDQAQRLDPDNAVVYNNRGKAYDSLGEYRQAIQDFDQALRIDPSSTVADNNRAIALDHLYKSRETDPRRRRPLAGRR